MSQITLPQVDFRLILDLIVALERGEMKIFQQRSRQGQNQQGMQGYTYHAVSLTLERGLLESLFATASENDSTELLVETCKRHKLCLSTLWRVSFQFFRALVLLQTKLPRKRQAWVGNGKINEYSEVIFILGAGGGGGGSFSPGGC